MDPQQVLVGTQEALTARRVFGEPISVNGVTIIPAAVVSGGGGGGGKGTAEAGVGFGLIARPAGVYVVRSDDAWWRPAVDVNRIVLGGQIVGVVALLVLGPVIGRWLDRRR
jgi:uncharacterized spore protein YtfJ